MALDQALLAPGVPTQATSHGIAYANYNAASTNNSAIEEQIGLSLAKNGEVPKLAKQIAEKSGIATKKSPATGALTPGVDQMGGARAYDEGWETIGSSVFAIMHEIEKTPANKTKYSISHSKDHPYFPEEQKKPEFDEPIRNLKFDELPTNIQNIIKPPSTAQINFSSGTPNHKLTTAPLGVSYDDLNPTARGKLLSDIEFGYKSAAAQDTADALKGQLTALIPSGSVLETVLATLKANPNDNNARVSAIAEIKAKMTAATAAATPAAADEKKAQFGALLDIVVDKHTSGDHANLVKKDGTGGVKDQWIDDTIAAGKPIISGPSGHTLRFLNFWSEKREEQDKAEKTSGYTGGEHVTAWPSLEAARLVMMADLMPPKHHSYDEIMTSSIGITDKITPVLQYNHKSSYEDLNTQTQADAQGPAQTAYTSTGADAVGSDNGIDSIMGNRLHVDNLKAALLTKLESALKGKSTTDAEALINTLDHSI